MDCCAPPRSQSPSAVITRALGMDRRTVLLGLARIASQGISKVWKIAPGPGSKPHPDKVRFTKVIEATPSAGDVPPFGSPKQPRPWALLEERFPVHEVKPPAEEPRCGVLPHVSASPRLSGRLSPIRITQPPRPWALPGERFPVHEDEPAVEARRNRDPG